MPRVSEFYGIVIAIFYNDHEPAHFHAVYGGSRATFTISPVGPLSGSLPRRARALVEEWAEQHTDELATNWQRARRHEPLLSIAPLD